jgi:hypothetical protein
MTSREYLRLARRLLVNISAWLGGETADPPPRHRTLD